MEEVVEKVLKKHIREIKVRVIYTIMSIMTTFISAYMYSEEMTYVIAKPLQNAHLDGASATIENGGFRFIFTELSEAF